MPSPVYPEVISLEIVLAGEVKGYIKCTFRTISHQSLLSIIYDILFLTQSSVVAAGVVSFLKKVMFLIVILILFCKGQSVIIYWFSATLLPSELLYSQ